MNKSFCVRKEKEEMKSMKRNVIVSAFLAIALCMSVMPDNNNTNHGMTTYF